MPSGKVHAVCSVLLSASSFGAALGMTNNVSIASACAGGCLLGIPLTPDLDQENLGMSERWLIKHTLGLGYLFAMFWYPYARAIPHRSPWSHLPIVGTIGRLTLPRDSNRNRAPNWLASASGRHVDLDGVDWRISAQRRGALGAGHAVWVQETARATRGR
jgi:hypothetical protein